MTERIGQQLGNYRLIQLLGKGGFADTYQGEHIYLKTFAAIKVLQTRLGQVETDAFHNEARIIARLKHPHIVRILEFDVKDHIPYIVMDYAPNGTLRQRCPRGSILPPTTVVSYVKQLAAALSYAHQQKLIHRDVKPENILLGPDEEVLLSDFGVAIIAQTQAQYLENIAGTVTYMAPEQIQGKPRPASDQYALGITVYEWLCGATPFSGTYTEIALQHERVPPPSLRKQVSTIPSEVEDVVLTALAKDPQKRFATIQAFAVALGQAYGDQPTKEQPLSMMLANSQVHLPARVTPSSPPQLVHGSSPVITAENTVHLSQRALSTPPYAHVNGQYLSASPVLPATSDHRQAAQPLPLPGVLPRRHNSALPFSFLFNQQKQPLSLGPQAPDIDGSSSSHNSACLLSPHSLHQENTTREQLILPGIHTPTPTSEHVRPFHYRELSMSAITLLFFLVIFIIGGSGLFYFTTTYQPNAWRFQATATAGASIIATAQASTTSQAQATTGAIATQTAQQEIYTQATSNLPIINDPLTSPDDFGWNSTQYTDAQNKGIGSCQFIENAYHDAALPGYLINCMATQTHFSNLAYQIELTIVDGNSGGLVIRGDSNSSGYYFRLSANGTYFFQKISSDTSGNIRQTVLASGSNSAIKTGHNQTNLITVIARGKNFYLYINKQYVDSTNDGTYTSGQIGVYAESDTSQTEVIFRNARIWKL